MAKPVTVLGAGAWGTAFAHLLADNNIDVVLWCYEEGVAQTITKSRRNKKYLPSVVLPDRVRVTSSLSEALSDASFIFETVPVKYLRTVLQQSLQACPSVSSATWIILSKGIEQKTLLLPSMILEQILGKSVCYAVIGGPNFAAELVQRVFTATVIASSDKNVSTELSQLLANDYFKTFTTDDPYGVQVGGAIKNVLALAIGYAYGEGYKHKNTTAYLFSQGLAEVGLLAEHFGGTKDTVYGIAGLGDMILSCTGTLSKNFRLGMLLGKGLTLEQAIKRFNVAPEGINTLQSLHELIQQSKLHLPLCMGIYRCIFEGLPFKQALLSI